MRIIVVILFFAAVLMAIVGAGTGDFYDAARGTQSEVPDTWDKEVLLYIGALVLALMALVLRWFHDRTLCRRGEQPFFPEPWLRL